MGAGVGVGVGAGAGARVGVGETGLTLRIQASNFEIPVAVSAANNLLGDGVDHHAQVASHGPAGGIVVLLRELPANTALTVSW